MAIPTTDTFMAPQEHDANGVFAEDADIQVKESVPTAQAEGGAQFQVDAQYAIETIAYEAKYEDCVTAARENYPGKWLAEAAGSGFSIQGGVFASQIERLPAGQGKITFTMYKFEDEPPGTDAEGDPLPIYPEEDGSPSIGGAPFAQYYSVQNARYDIPIARYMGFRATDPPTTLITCPDAFVVDLWTNEPDQLLKRRLGYNYDGEEYLIDPDSLTGMYILKLMEGKESVLRFYPVVTRVSLWWTACAPFSATPGTTGSDNAQQLGHICNPLKYASLGTEWLKVQDDLEGEGPVLTRTECWMASEAWDLQMYGWGTDRWEWGSEILSGDIDEPPPE